MGNRLKERFAANIICCRTVVREETIRAYIENLKEIAKNLPAENIWNLDETNLTDDAGKRRLICCCAPKYCRLESTKSGLFDSLAFNNWFESLMLPKLKKLFGKKVLITDSVSTHLNVTIFQKCREENISFVCFFLAQQFFYSKEFVKLTFQHNRQMQSICLSMVLKIVLSSDLVVMILKAC